MLISISDDEITIKVTTATAARCYGYNIGYKRKQEEKKEAVLGPSLDSKKSFVWELRQPNGRACP